MLRLGNADGARTTASEPHRAAPETSILGPTHRAQKIEVLLLTNMIFVHAQLASVHKVGGAHENIINNFVHIHSRFVINAIPLNNSPAFLILETIACNRVPVSLSKFCSSTGEATALEPISFCQARLDNQLPSGPSNPFCT